MNFNKQTAGIIQAENTLLKAIKTFWSTPMNLKSLPISFIKFPNSLISFMPIATAFSLSFSFLMVLLMCTFVLGIKINLTLLPAEISLFTFLAIGSFLGLFVILPLTLLVYWNTTK